jgi:hypothetical protein
MAATFCDDIPTVTVQRSKSGLNPEFAIQRYSCDARAWRMWDCAYTRVEADNLLTCYMRRYRALGLGWRIARIVYDQPPSRQIAARTGFRPAAGATSYQIT